jgi:hypothetical protein
LWPVVTRRVQPDNGAGRIWFSQKVGEQLSHSDIVPRDFPRMRFLAQEV